MKLKNKAPNLAFLTLVLGTLSWPALASPTDIWEIEENEPVEALVLEPEAILFKGVKVSKNEALAKSTLQMRILDKKSGASLPNCSATLIAKDIILTAAHCFNRGGSFQITRYDNGKPEHIDITKTIVHPRYQYRKSSRGGDQVTHDIALGKLARAIEDGVIASVPTSDLRIKPRTKVVSAGYGLNGRKLDEKEALARPEVQLLVKEIKNPKLSEEQKAILTRKLILMLIENPLLKANLLASIVKLPHAVTSVLALEGPQNICSGDSGGPTFMVTGDKLMVIGVHSTAEATGGEECSANQRAGIAGLFDSSYLKAHDTYVPFYAEWIEATVKKLKAEKEI